MQPRYLREDIPRIICAAFPEKACSVEWRDFYARLSLQIYGAEGELLLATPELRVTELRIKSILASRIEHWLSLSNRHLNR